MARTNIHLLTVVFLSTCLTLEVTSFNVTFEKVSTLYLPYEYDPVTYGLDEDAAEQMSYDPATKLLYSVGNTNIHVIDLSATNYSMNVIHRVSYDDVDEITDVDVCGNFLFVAFDNDTDTSQGFVNVYEAYNRQSNSFNLIHTIVVGNGPDDRLHPTSDCSKVLVVRDGEIYTDDQGTMVDPPGGVGIIKFNTTPADSYTYTFVGFEAFNSKVSELEQSGVRFVYRGNNNNFSNDVEPEYIAFNHDETKAYVSLQENNAIAVLDMQTETFENIYGLGFKNWSLFTMDPSDRDGGINMNPWPALGIYEPDGITVWMHNNVDYILTANEGEYKEGFIDETRVGEVTISAMFGINLNPWPVLGIYEPDGFTVWRHNNVDYLLTANEGEYKEGFIDERRVGDVTISAMSGINMNPWPVLGIYEPDGITVWMHNNVDYILTANEGEYKEGFIDETRVRDVTLSAMFEPNATERARLQEDQNLGRLKITTENGRNPTSGEYDQLYSFGGRSFSIWRADDMTLMYDSGNDLSYRTATLKPYLFNSDPDPDQNITASRDTLSAEKGEEPETIKTAEIGNYTLILVGIEKPGTIAVYSLDNRLPTIEPKFETLLSDIPEVDETWSKVYNERRLSMLDPEGIRFVSESESPHGEPLLIVGASYSGTITVFKVIVDLDESGDPSSSNRLMPIPVLTLGTVTLFLMKKYF